MPSRILLLPEFIRKLQLEGPIRLTWLIGAGMSASANVPLAADVTRRLILFDHLCDKSLQVESWQHPWSSDTRPLSYDDFDKFLEWYDRHVNNESFKTLQSEANAGLSRKKGYEGITPENPQCYPLLFANAFISDKSHHVLTSLVRRARGVNIAHLALAGILRDHPRWGHTVFTTNFDDLLLKSSLILNHTARVFGEIQSTDRPTLQPTYPQIVHLHGRHTGYRLANTEEQFKLLDPNLKRGFLEHLRGSYLIVVGYSGWDDMAMSALKEWHADDTLVNGIFWVPYKDESHILESTRHFLDACPPHRASIIVSEDRNLTADSFMLGMCRAVNRKVGFAPYRKGIVDYAHAQHTFTLEQLEEHPNDNPVSATLDATLAVRAGRKRDADACHLHVAAALNKIDGDAPSIVVAAVYLLVGTSFFLLRKDGQAEDYIRKSMVFWSPEPHAGPHNDGMARTCLILGQLLLRKGDLSGAHVQFKHARRHADHNGNTELRSRALLGHASTTLRYSINDAMGNIDESISSAPHTTSLTTAEARKVRADILAGSGNVDDAKNDYLDAIRQFEELECVQGAASALKGLSRLESLTDDPSAVQLLHKSMVRFEEIGDQFGVAIVNQELGDRLLAKEHYLDALRHYDSAHEYFGNHGYVYSQCSAAADIARCRQLIADVSGNDCNVDHTDWLQRSQKFGNTYAEHILRQLSSK